MSAVSVGALVAAALLVAPVVVGGPAEAAVVKSVKGKNVTSRRITAPSNNVTEVLLEDGTVITLSPGASIDIVSFTYNGGNDGSLRLKVNNGTVRISGGLANNRNTFTIETPQASIALDAGTALVAVSGGETKAHLLNGAGFTFTSNNRSKRIFRPGFKTTSNGGSPTRPARVDQREIQNDLALLKISVVPVRVLPRASAGNNQTANGLPPAGPDDDNITTGSINSSSSQQQQSGDPGLADEPVNLAAADEEDGTNGFDDPVNVNNPITVDDQTGQVTPVVSTPEPDITLRVTSFNSLANGINFGSATGNVNASELKNVNLIRNGFNDATSGSSVRATSGGASNNSVVTFKVYPSFSNGVSSNQRYQAIAQSLELDNIILQSESFISGFQQDNIKFIKDGADFNAFYYDISTGIALQTDDRSNSLSPDQIQAIREELGRIHGPDGAGGNLVFPVIEDSYALIITRVGDALDAANFNEINPLLSKNVTIDTTFTPTKEADAGKALNDISAKPEIENVETNLEYSGKLLASGVKQYVYLEEHEFAQFGEDIVTLVERDNFLLIDLQGDPGTDFEKNQLLLASGDLDGAVNEVMNGDLGSSNSGSGFDPSEQVVQYFVTSGLDSNAITFDADGFPVLNTSTNDQTPLISEGLRAFQSFESFEGALQQNIIDTGLLVVSQKGDAKFQNSNVFAHFDIVFNDTGEGENRVQDSSISTTLGQVGYIFSRNAGNVVSLVDAQPDKLQVTDSADVFAAGRTIGSSSGGIVNGNREGSVSFTSGIFSTASGGGNPAAPGDGDLGFLVLENYGNFSSDVTDASLDGQKLSAALGVPNDGVLPGGTSFAVGDETRQDLQYGLLRLATAVGGLNLDLSESGGYNPRSFASFIDQGGEVIGFANGLVEIDDDGGVKVSTFYGVTESGPDSAITRQVRENFEGEGTILATNGFAFNTKPNLTISVLNEASSTIGGEVTYSAFDENSGKNNEVKFDLGAASAASTSQANAAGSVYISNDLFALASQFDVTEFQRGVTKDQQNVAFVSSDFVKEGLPKNKSEFDAARNTDYKHVQWGFFFGDAFDRNGNAHHVHMGTFATGTKIAADIADKGKVRYDGHLIGNVINQGNTYVAGGTFTDTFDFGTRKGQTAVQFDGRNFNGVSGSSGSSYASVVTSGDSFTGTLSGNFVGGLNTAGTPNGLAGQFAIENGGSYNAVGTFAADGTVLK